MKKSLYLCAMLTALAFAVPAQAASYETIAAAKKPQPEQQAKKGGKAKHKAPPKKGGSA